MGFRLGVDLSCSSPWSRLCSPFSRLRIGLEQVHAALNVRWGDVRGTPQRQMYTERGFLGFEMLPHLAGISGSHRLQMVGSRPDRRNSRTVQRRSAVLALGRYNEWDSR